MSDQRDHSYNPFDAIADHENHDSQGSPTEKFDRVDQSNTLGLPPAGRFSGTVVFIVVVTLTLVGVFFLVANTSPALSREDYGRLSRDSPFLASLVRSYPQGVTEWDFMTDHDAMYLHRLRPIVDGELLPDWDVVRSVRHTILDFSDEALLSWHLKDTMVVNGQSDPDLIVLQQALDDCAERLGLAEKPILLLKQDNDPNAYVTGMEITTQLVVTSELLDIYKDRPDELRFIIGHELGHIVCGHVRAHSLAKAMIAVLSGNQEDTIRSEILTPLATLELLHWFRSSEMSCDRAGLVCVGRVNRSAEYPLQVAEQALLRLLHGTERTMDVDVYLTELDKLVADHKFADLLTMVRGLGRSHPFIADRCRELRRWVHDGEYDSLFDRGVVETLAGTVVVENVRVAGLPRTDAGNGECDCRVRITGGIQSHLSSVVDDSSSAAYSGLNWQLPYIPNIGLIVDVYDEDITDRDLVGTAVLRINGTSGTFRGPVILVEDDQSQSNPVIELDGFVVR